MPVLNCTLQGRFGNQVMQYLFARGVADRYGFHLHCDAWIGEQVFDLLPAYRYNGPALKRYNEIDIYDGMRRCEDVEFRGYAQMQDCMTYTKRQAQQWLRISPVFLTALQRIMAHHFGGDTIVAHHRKGDFIGCSYPVVSQHAYHVAAHDYFGFGSVVRFVSEEKPLLHQELPEDLSFLPDFYRLMCAPTLMRANSTFSFVAGLLNNGVVLSPRIDGLKGGVEHDNVRFEAGNHCKLADFDFCTDLHVSP